MDEYEKKEDKTRLDIKVSGSGMDENNTGVVPRGPYNEIHLEVKNPHWKDNIREAYKQMKDDIVWLYPNNTTETFLSVIWNASKKAFDIPREVQVMIDANENLYISYGTPGFVSFEGHEDELINGAPMKLPIKCWIHTHPFGTAFWSMTDWKSLKTWQPVLDSAIVLGDNEYLAYDLKTKIGKKVLFGLMEPPETVIDYKTEEEELSVIQIDEQIKKEEE